MIGDHSEMLKYIDFGQAKEPEHESLQSTKVGTCRYMAPEVHFGCGKRFDQKVDIWFVLFILWFIENRIFLKTLILIFEHKGH